MAIEVITAVLALTNAPQTAATLTQPHQRVSVNVAGPVTSPNALSSVWQILGVNAGGVTALLWQGTLTQLLGAAKGQAILAGQEANGLVCSLRCISPFGAAPTITAVLIGWDPSFAIPTNAGSNNVYSLTPAETDVATLGGGFSRINCYVDASADLTPAPQNSIWRLYSTAGGIRTLVAQASLGSINGATGVLPANVPQDLFGDLLLGSDGYVLTAQSAFATGTAASIKATILGQTLSGSNAGAAGVTLGGDVVGPSTANQVQTLSGGNGGNAGFINLTGFIGVGAFASLPTLGFLRFGTPNLGTAATFISAINSIAANASVVSTSGANDLAFGGAGNNLTQLVGATSAQLAISSGSAVFQLNSTGPRLISGSLQSLFFQTFAGSFKFDSDSNLTGYDFALNGGASLLGIRANWNIGQTASGASVSFDGTNINLKVGAANVAQLNANQFTTNKGIVRALRTSAVTSTLTAADDILIFTAAAQTANLPTAGLTLGQKFTVGYNGVGTGIFTINGGTNNIVYKGSAAATAVSSNVTPEGAITVSWNVTNWVAAQGY